MSTERHACSERIFTGARWDMGGHMCSINAKYQDDEGNWWCKRHLPDSKAARAAARDMKQRELNARRDDAQAAIQGLLDRIGLQGYPTRQGFSKFGDPPTGAYVPHAALQALADRIGDDQ